MSLEKELKARSGEKCELCGAEKNLKVYAVPPVMTEDVDKSILVCPKCLNDIENEGSEDANHWRCLNDSMWSEVSAVQVVAWRMLNRLRAEGWPQDLLDIMYLDDETMKWAKAIGVGEDDNKVKHIDSNGVELKSGDNVVVVKDLNVKGGGFTAKRGTAVRNIHLVEDNSEQIEGRVNGQMIVLLTKYVKKS